MKSPEGKPVFCNTCDNRGNCVGELSDTIDIRPEGARIGDNQFYRRLRLQDQLHGSSKEMSPLDNSRFNHMEGRKDHMEAAGKILRERVAACTGPNATGECVIVDVTGITEAIYQVFPPS